MSTKTLRKRIALVAVSAMGFGLLTSTNAGATSLLTMQNAALWISTTSSTTGAAVGGTNPAATVTSLGWLADTSTSAATSASGGLQISGSGAYSGTVLAGAQISVIASNNTGTDGISIVVTGGTLSSIAATAGGAAANTSSNGAATTATTDPGVQAQLGAVFKSTGAAGTTATIAAYSGSGITGTSNATSANLIGIWTLTVASASASGVFSAGDSVVTQQACVAKSGTASGTNTYDTTSKCQNGYAGVVYFSLKDAYSVAITSGTLGASVSSGTVNAVATAAAGDAYAASTGFDTLSLAAGTGYIVVNQPTANTAGSTTLTITLDGATIATKTISWQGDAASIEVDTVNSNASFADGAADGSGNIGVKGVVYKVKDAAGNVLDWSSFPTLTGLTGSMVNASLASSTNTAISNKSSNANGYGNDTMKIATSSLNGAGTYQLKITNAQGVALTSAVQKVTVSNGSTDSFAISWDKASYAPGEIATLSITLKDVYGNKMAAGTALTGLSLSVATGFTSVGTACSATTAVLDGGVATCKYAAGNDEGAYSYSVDVTTATPQSASVGAVNIKSASSTVTNAEVLAAIVKLIASINKQIAALQKALKK